ncbi:MAG: Protein LemA [Candidatus Parcubacteria bacterium]|jgi:LemA protein
MSPLIIGLIVLAVLIVIVIAMYNSLVTLRMRVKEAWSDIEVQFKRRYDLIPNLVSTVKGSANFETSTLEKVVAARNAAMATTGTGKEHAEAENMLSGTLKSIFALAESYPDLKSNQNFLQLQNELSDTENKIQAARRFYNSNVMAYNTKIQTVPSNLIAKMFSFTEEVFFELDEADQAAKNPVNVSF